MIHMELAPSTLLGLCLTMQGIFLYFIRIKKRQVSRDYDLFFSSVGFLCGGILIFQGWRLDPILLLCQMMSGVTAIFFITETLWLRNIHIECQNLLNTNNKDLAQNVIVKKKMILKKYGKDLVQSEQVSSNVLNTLLRIDYTFPIDYY